MDYIKQLNAFYAQMEHNPVSANASALWNALMHICNKTRWLEYYTVANKALEVKSGLEISSLQRARRELINKHLLVYIPGKGRYEAAKYHLPVLYEQVDGEGNCIPVHNEHINEQVKDIPIHNEQVSEQVKDIPVHNGQVSEQVSEQVGEHINKHKQKLNKNLNKKESERHTREDIPPGAAAPTPPLASKPSPKTLKAITHAYGEYGWVKLTDVQYQRLSDDFSEGVAKHFIGVVDEKAQMKNNSYNWKDWNLVVRKAIRENWGDYSQRQGGIQNTTGNGGINGRSGSNAPTKSYSSAGRAKKQYGEILE